MKDEGRRDHTLTSAIRGPSSGVHFIHGNGHMMMLEKNSDDIAKVMADWLDHALPGK